jgi:hypothetical protein
MAKSDTLVLKTVNGKHDIERLNVFNELIHGDDVGPFTQTIIEHHPASDPLNFPFIEDTATGEIVSALCLIPWRWQCDGVTLRCAEMGIVGTSEAYRKQGLIRWLNDYFQERVAAGEYDLCMIQGIPYFYRQLGYEYAIPLEGGYRVDLHTIPDAMPEGITLREATAEDIPLLMKFDATSSNYLDIYAERDEAIWQFLLGPSLEGAYRAPTTIASGSDGKPLGYWRVFNQSMFGGLHVGEASDLPAQMVQAAFVHFKQLATERDEKFIRLNLPVNHPVTRLAPQLYAMDTHAWQILIPDPVRTLSTLKAAFEKRLANSPYAGLTETYIINLYRNAYGLQFENGQLTEVQDLGFREGGHLRLPPNLLPMLLMGHKTRAEMREFCLDVGCALNHRPLTDVLFPRLRSFIYQQY